LNKIDNGRCARQHLTEDVNKGHRD
jgi:hypothetical protein